MQIKIINGENGGYPWGGGESPHYWQQKYAWGLSFTHLHRIYMYPIPLRKVTMQPRPPQFHGNVLMQDKTDGSVWIRYQELQ